MITLPSPTLRPPPATLTPTLVERSDWPRHPRLLIDGPVVWRCLNELQIGLGSPHLILRGVPPTMMAAVGLLDGYHDHREVARAIGPDWAHWLLAVLDGQDALTDGPATAALGPHVHVVGAGPLARAVAIRLAATGAGRRIERRDHADHLDLADRPDIVVLAGSAIEADRVAASRLTAAGISHLIVRAGFGRAVLGPFVLPGVTSCLRCLDLNRRRGDPAWPLVAFQLAQCDAPTDRLLIGWLAALTAIEVATWRSGRLPDTSSATLTYDRAEAADTRRAWPVHPRCDCRAAARYRGPGDLAG